MPDTCAYREAKACHRLSSLMIRAAFSSLPPLLLPQPPPHAAPHAALTCQPAAPSCIRDPFEFSKMERHVHFMHGKHSVRSTRTHAAGTKRGTASCIMDRHLDRRPSFLWAEMREVDFSWEKPESRREQGAYEESVCKEALLESTSPRPLPGMGR
ncbi:uncharacterized protein B0I36DRAFT_316820 [Microdochium trichocladiopsis]|uniref:Uncharacterized protein n=1 Tax=Microdochium trichocladiopsis TaxID=1682393 RepID=A0A9P9BQC1_9PEZI|nr:uncharacterized protein B0I36DRAFT_316820 [Microdochium trichocladiopsis]KAH7034723.1 hypothetical protein B0I36DRAFT_316820 [Microdochium trichocladiopsis]